MNKFEVCETILKDIAENFDFLSEKEYSKNEYTFIKTTIKNKLKESEEIFEAQMIFED